MTREEAGSVRRQIELTEEQAITLRRIAYGESEARTLRPADLSRLAELRLIARGRHGPELTKAGKEHFDSLPRALFAGKLR
jgi:hypothetical protein